MTARGLLLGTTLGLALGLLLGTAPASAQDADVGALSGTLKKIRDSGTITLGYRASSLPFSYLNKREQPIGYSIDLCGEIAEAAAAELGIEIKTAFAPVTAADRLAKVQAGAIDLECGSTTSNLQRRPSGVFAGVLRRRH